MKYPNIMVHVGNGFAPIEVHHRPNRAILKQHKVELTGEFRVPRPGESYWYPPRACDFEGKVVKRATHRCKNRYHILRRIEPRLAVMDEGSGIWMPIPISEVRDMLEQC